MPQAIAAISAAAIRRRGATFQDTLARDDMGLDASYDLIINDLVGLLRVGTEYHETVRSLALAISKEDRLPPKTVEEWRGYARDMGTEAADLRAMLATFGQLMEPFREVGDPKSRIVLRLFDVWAEQTKELADRIEDVAETMALAVHGPFRDAVQDRLREASAA